MVIPAQHGVYAKRSGRRADEQPGGLEHRGQLLLGVRPRLAEDRTEDGHLSVTDCCPRRESRQPPAFWVDPVLIPITPS